MMIGNLGLGAGNNSNTNAGAGVMGGEYVLDQSRDLTLIVGGGGGGGAGGGAGGVSAQGQAPGQGVQKCYSIVVSSQILRIASPVW